MTRPTATSRDGLFETLAAVDFDSRACEVYRANFPGVDVRCSTVADALPTLPDCDLIVGGPPCQSFSTAGKGKGRDDARDGWPEFVAAVEARRPRMFLAENVPGMMREAFLPYVRDLYERLTLLGYQVEIEKLDAVNYGAPQFRKRVWFWGIRKDVFEAGASHCWPKPTHAWPWPDPDQPSMFGGELLPAVTVGQALGVNAVGQEDRIRLAENGGGNGNSWSKGPACTVDGGGLDAHEYRYSPEMLAKHPPAEPAEPSPTVMGKWFKGGAEGLVKVDPKHPVQQSEKPASTINAVGDGHSPTGNATALQIDTKQHRTEQGVDEPSGTVAHDDRRHLKADGVYVRRLTYRECAKLQSCPDSMIWPENITKTAAYRVVGNGWNCAMAGPMGRALHEADPESRTIVDLFSGGGLGSMGLHQRYWTYQPAALVRANLEPEPLGVMPWLNYQNNQKNRTRRTP